MSLLIILLALALERLLNAGIYLHRFAWFEAYLGGLRKVLGGSFLWKGIPGVIIVVLPLALGVGILYYGLGFLFFNILGFILSLFILLYCLGPVDLYAQLKTYLAESALNHPHQGMLSNLDTLVKTNIPAPSLGRAITQSILIQFNERVFAILFWFVLVGPLGPVIYRVVSLLRHEATKETSPDAAMAGGATTIQAILDWIPARILGFAYALAGNFISGFSAWLNYAKGGLNSNEDLLLHSGLKALELQEEDAINSGVEENRTALALTDRALIIFLVVLALIILL